MKKNNLNLEGVAVLTKEQQKMVNGGAGTCYALLGRAGDGHPIGLEAASYQEVQDALAANGGGRWCCDSCHTATWLVSNAPYGGSGYWLN